MILSILLDFFTSHKKKRANVIFEAQIKFFFILLNQQYFRFRAKNSIFTGNLINAINENKFFVNKFRKKKYLKTPKKLIKTI